MAAASKLVDENVRKDFLIIGGAALVKYGSSRRTDDVDIAITAATLNMFMEQAKTDPRFKLHPDDEWSYTCQGEGIAGLDVRFEFLELGGPFVPKMHGMTKFRDVCLASLADIVLMKAHAYQGRGEEADFIDMRFALRLMAEKGETFQRFKFKSSEIRVISDVVGDDEGMRNLLTQMTE
jgi:hypothetical protein